MRTVIVFTGDKSSAICTEQAHPKDAQFLAYQILRGDSAGQWLGVGPNGDVIAMPSPDSYAAFTLATNAAYLIADRTATALGGRGCYRLGYLVGTEPFGPIA